MNPGAAGAPPRRSCSVRRIHRTSRIGHHHVLLFLSLLAAAGGGCGTASPRYKSPERPPQSRPHDDDEASFVATIREEEMREDDRKVDLAMVRETLVPATPPAGAVLPPGNNRDRVLLDLVGYLGTPYRHGGESKEGMDCSGLTMQVFGSALQVKLPRSTREQYQAGADVGREQLQFGDLVFFNTTGRSPSHVGIYLEDNLFAHASVSFGVTISSLESGYYRKRFVGARRLAGGPGGTESSATDTLRH